MYSRRAETSMQWGLQLPTTRVFTRQARASNLTGRLLILKIFTITLQLIDVHTYPVYHMRMLPKLPRAIANASQCLDISFKSIVPSIFTFLHWAQRRVLRSRW